MKATCKDFPAFTSLGCYPILYYSLKEDCGNGDLNPDGDVWCSECAEQFHNSSLRSSGSSSQDQDCSFTSDIHWEGPDEQCCHCNKAIASAYGDPNADESERK